MTRGDTVILNTLNSPETGGTMSRFLSLLRRPTWATPALAHLTSRFDIKRIQSRKFLLTVSLCAVSGLAIAAIHWHGSTTADASIPGGPAKASANVMSRGPSVARRSDRPRPYSQEYAVLLSRSIFAADGSPLNGKPSAGAAQSSVAAGSAAPSTFALKGISQEDASFTAFVEDTVARRIVQVHVGDTLGQGQVRDMTLQDLNYEIGGKVVHVEIGQGLDGNPFIASAVNPDSISKPEHHKHKHDADGGDVRASAADGGN
ncbi:MAG TPA: hypothetical protein VFE47_02850 [Tepidisphaeraceae bacterium]|jgi:hypothetical protein|nr:hypothetical protein [Tepidisphaeraceae bacterium]